MSTVGQLRKRLKKYRDTDHICVQLRDADDIRAIAEIVGTKLTQSAIDKILDDLEENPIVEDKDLSPAIGRQQFRVDPVTIPGLGSFESFKFGEDDEPFQEKLKTLSSGLRIGQ